MPTMRFEQFGDTVAMVHTADAPSDTEWDAMLAFLRTHWPARVLVFTEGGGPTTLQRGRLNDALGKDVMSTAVVTSSAVVRGIVTALSWFNPGIKTFSPDGAAAALRYLGVPAEERHELMRRVSKMSSELKPGGLKCVVWSEQGASSEGGFDTGAR
ncbi:MAG: hypothetical protein HOW73_26860 [Polyangiaceae bacterium]|nr:hypothetical protein [Polyangiaceae bacterium]